MVIQGRGKPPGAQEPETTFYDHVDHSKPTEHPPRIREYRALKRMPLAAEALAMLRRIGAIVKPLMIKHNWELPLLVEFLPKQDNLLGTNLGAGKKISLRLRWNHAQDALLDEDSVVQTMLHELTHNVRGPHDQVFFDFLEKLTEEYWELKRKGFVDFRAFAGQAHRLGGSAGSVALTPKQLRERAAKEAEKRGAYSALNSGPQRLGGAPPRKTPQELAAEVSGRARAAEEHELTPPLFIAGRRETPAGGKGQLPRQRLGDPAGRERSSRRRGQVWNRDHHDRR